MVFADATCRGVWLCVRHDRAWRPRGGRGGAVSLAVLLAIWQVLMLGPQAVWGQVPLAAEAEVEALPAAEVRSEASGEAASAEAANPGHPLWVMNADGSGLRQLVTMSDYTAHGSPEYSTDGTKIAFDAWRPGEGEDYGDADVFVASGDGSSPKNLGPGAMPSLSPRGKRIVFSKYEPHGVWVMYADGSGQRQLDPEGWGGQWSPDGRMLAWTAREEGVANIRVYDLIEGELRMVLEGKHCQYGTIYQGFDWSPDGKRLCFKGVNLDGQEELAIAHAEGSSQGFKVRVKEKTGPNVAWSPDGKQILMNKWCKERKRQQVYVLDPDSDEPPKLLAGQDPERSNTSGEWSPDGKKIVFASGQK